MALVGFLLFGLFFFLLFMEVPVAFALGISAITTIYVFDLTFTDEIARQLFYAMDSYTLLAIPLFLLVGHLLGKSKLAKNLLDLVMILAGGIRGGVAIVTVIVSLLFAGISGSGPADVAALGVLLFPLLKESGFTPSRSAALLAAGGGIGIIVPPSIALIIYGVVAEASIGKLFIAGIVPGILISLSLIIAVRFLARKDRLVVQKPPLTWDVLFGSLLAMMAPLVILGGIYSGTFTPTESAGIAVVYIFIVDSIFYRSFFQKGVLSQVMAQAGRSAAQILFIIANASLFSSVLHMTELTEVLGQLILQLTTNKILLLLLLNAFLLFSGCFIDAISITYIFVPIFLPVLQQIGVDPIHFGIILTVNLAIGQITPPIGVNLFVASSFSQIDIAHLSRAVIPFLLAEIITLLLITFLPSLSLTLPNYFS